MNVVKYLNRAKNKHKHSTIINQPNLSLNTCLNKFILCSFFVRSVERMVMANKIKFLPEPYILLVNSLPG